MKLMKFLEDLFKGPDGETWAIGRLYSIPTLLAGLGYPVVALLKGQTISMSELAVLLPATAAAVLALVAGTNHVDNPIKLPEKPS